MAFLGCVIDCKTMYIVQNVMIQAYLTVLEPRHAVNAVVSERIRGRLHFSTMYLI